MMGRASELADLDHAGWQGLLAAEERRLGLTQGFKMLYGPWSSLGTASVAFLSLKPGAAPPGADLRTVSDERGNSYKIERSTTVSPITEQFLALAALLGHAPREILSGVVAPFRAAAWEEMTAAQKDGALALGRRFWAGPLARPDLRLVLAVSQEAADLVVALTGAALEAEIPAGWGNLRLRRYRTGDGRTVVHLPHLSRFRLLSRASSREAVARALSHSGFDQPRLRATVARRPAKVELHEDAAPDATLAGLPTDVRTVLEAIRRSPDYDLEVLAQQMAVSFRGRKIGGLNRRLMEWYVSKVFVAAQGGPAPLERRGFRLLETSKGHRYWAQKGAAAAPAFAAAIGEMTGVSL